MAARRRFNVGDMQMKTLVFPGQGSQTLGMGAELFPLYADLISEASGILGYDIIELCLHNTDNKLNNTAYTQPLLYTVNALNYLEFKKQHNTQPDYLAGHSLGEYNALFAAEVFDFLTGLKLVQMRGKLMSQAHGGSMAAILGVPAQAIQDFIAEHNFSDVVIANYNSPTQYVISGPSASMTTIHDLINTHNFAKIIPLNVSGAFHSPMMLAAREEFKSFLNTFKFNAPKIPVIANASAKPYKHLDDVADTLAQQITSPVHWLKTVQYLKQQGDMEFIELGPGKVLTGLIKRIV
jgi:malonyl CoA-acyl carrier protein transacylase